MNAKFFRILFVAIFATAALFAVINPAPAFAQEGQPPKAWTVPVCNGEAAIVFQSRNETGDGVTVAPYDEQECEVDENLGWYVVEPWNPEVMNPDAGCLATTWSSVGVMARETTWENGSAWRVNTANFKDHPMVVECSQVTGQDSLGLNPNERQVELARQDWVVARAVELLTENDMTPAQYCADFDEPLATYLCALPAFTSAEVAKPAVPADEVTTSSDGCEKGTRDGEFLCAPDGTWVYAPVAVQEDTSPNADNGQEQSGRDWWWWTWRIVVGLILAGGAYALFALLPVWWKLFGIIPVALLVWLVWVAVASF